MFHDKKADSATFAKAMEFWGKRGTVAGKPELPPVK
jgi:hypothetical protein